MLEKFGFVFAGTLFFLTAAITMMVLGNPIYRGPIILILLLDSAGQFLAQDHRRWVSGLANAIAYFCWVALVFILAVDLT